MSLPSAEFRAALKSPDIGLSLLTQFEWRPGHTKPLHPFLNELAFNVLGWFKTDQEWSLYRVQLETSTFSSNLPPYQEDAPVSNQEGEVIHQQGQPDEITPNFHFQSPHPSLGGKPWDQARKLNVVGALAPDTLWYGYDCSTDKTNVSLDPRSVANVYKLQEALRDFSCPYFLDGVRISATSGWFDPHTERSRSLVVKVTLKDLGDYLRLEEAKTRRMRVRFNRTFSVPQVPNQEAQAAS